MKKLTVKKGSTCMACLECVRACSNAFYKEFDPGKSCIEIVEKKGAPSLWYVHSAANALKSAKQELSHRMRKGYIQ